MVSWGLVRIVEHKQFHHSSREVLIAGLWLVAQTTRKRELVLPYSLYPRALKLWTIYLEAVFCPMVCLSIFPLCRPSLTG
jgi:hypothetical protein